MDKNIRSWRSCDRQSERDSREWQLELNLLCLILLYFVLNILLRAGVPQGSVLGPLLFTMFVNEIPSIVSASPVLMFADDTKFSEIAKAILHYRGT